MKDCSNCEGTGEVEGPEEEGFAMLDCPKCEGTGKVEDDE